ncbi:hypothetical protein XCR1_970006 [Xenorhabdus cabanillasii JM26]|uniref:Uncharacterized protein n=1 Tax=Xenorhabdus cabanillasii JM26 TaxID=1427517 RepID=W1JCV7_9GAMM|nr:hypothetical protein XCR1_970006 [Xenorhabdus cabanillasii JM26]
MVSRYNSGAYAPLFLHIFVPNIFLFLIITTDSKIVCFLDDCHTIYSMHSYLLVFCIMFLFNSLKLIYRVNFIYN